MSITYIAQIAQFLVVFGVVTQVEMDVIVEFIVAFNSLAILLVGLWGRYRAGGINIFGIRE